MRIDAVGLHPATFADPGDIRVGDDVVVVGYALNLDGDPSVTTGIVSALHRTSADTTRALKGLIQTDAPISSGNSGGPLVNSLGQVVGIATFVVVSDQSSEANSVGFAISNEELLPRIEELRAAAGGEVAPSAFLGVSVTHRVDGGSGALVTEVAPSSPAAEAGVKAGDSIVSIDGTAITGRGGLLATVRDHQAGDRITITLMRGGARVDVHATLVKGPAG